MYVVLVGCAVISFIMWMAAYIAAKAMARYIVKKDFPLPSEKEIAECTHWAALDMFGLSSKRTKDDLDEDMRKNT